MLFYLEYLRGITEPERMPHIIVKNENRFETLIEVTEDEEDEYNGEDHLKKQDWKRVELEESIVIQRDVHSVDLDNSEEEAVITLLKTTVEKN